MCQLARTLQLLLNSRLQLRVLTNVELRIKSAKANLLIVLWLPSIHPDAIRTQQLASIVETRHRYHCLVSTIRICHGVSLGHHPIIEDLEGKLDNPETFLFLLQNNGLTIKLNKCFFL